MKRLNNKGFVVSTVLYGILIVVILIIILLMSLLATNRNSTKKLIEQLDQELVQIGINRNQQIEQQEYEKKLLCRRATSLHNTSCLGYQNNIGCYASGVAAYSNMTYGSLGTTGTLTKGDAFDCDVNGDKVYDSETERFYLLHSDENTATLIYYSNTIDGEHTLNKDYTAWGNRAPSIAIRNLPTTEQWTDNRIIYPTKRQIKYKLYDELEIITDEFDYTGFAARLLSIEDLIKMGYDILNDNQDLENISLKNDTFLLENTIYSNTNYPQSYWTEIWYSSRIYTDAYWVDGLKVSIYGEDSSVTNNNNKEGTRPVIDISIENIEK